MQLQSLRLEIDSAELVETSLVAELGLLLYLLSMDAKSAMDSMKIKIVMEYVGETVPTATSNPLMYSLEDLPSKVPSILLLHIELTSYSIQEFTLVLETKTFSSMEKL